jgi:Ca2+-transporting ATPase/Ca2+ transporting ATPase
VLARSSPDDKHTLVARLNGSLPDSEEAWLKAHPGCSWEKERDRLLPGKRPFI